MIISFDFDNTIGDLHWSESDQDFYKDDEGVYIQTPNLSMLQEVHNYIESGHKVIIVTSRHETSRFHIEEQLEKWNIPIKDIYFTNGDWKYKLLKELGVDKHYDDSVNELSRLEDIEGILVNGKEKTIYRKND